MINNKMKALSFSFDDGVLQDKRLIELLDKYELKCTFNLNSGFLGKKGSLIRQGVEVGHTKIDAEQIRDVYKNHEIAVHSFTHKNLTTLESAEIIEQVNIDQKILSALAGYEVYGMAYPCGGINNDDRVADIIKANTNIKFCRTIASTHNFDKQTNLYRYNPTAHWQDTAVTNLAEHFLQSNPSHLQILYIWGHSYEMDRNNGWTEIEQLFKALSKRPDVFYGTNSEILL